MVTTRNGKAMCPFCRSSRRLIASKSTCESHEFQQSIAPSPEVKQHNAAEGILAAGPSSIWYVAMNFCSILWHRFSLMLLYLNSVYLIHCCDSLHLCIFCPNIPWLQHAEDFDAWEILGQLIYVFFSQFCCVVFWWEQAIRMQPLGQG